ncbi:outer membrane protein assembly factor BamD [Robiginitalea sp. M366]|uniref:outer membrane protein assembly factor BamD n=1 Tax=Robiginitalea aestuariiviva TaxID=3036903 RepID=UPI00240DF9F5|nr:outer membrane protein assembly factor BamD [Robiginitalea aestuariiviva]MDG1573136.1 outer membrane protein assembly factor BamD [Robiginitalea aestuariiviva]
MFLKIKHLGLFLLFPLLFSCSEYQKVLKESDLGKKYELAQRLYEEEDYRRANRLLEQIAPRYVGKPQGERVLFFLADSYFKIGDYNFSGYQFERFLKSYPKSDKAAEAGFLGAKSYYLLSPRYSLDQTDTDKALGKLQIFINAYPESEFMAEANQMARELTEKKEKKAFEIAKQFVKLGKSYTLDYNISAITSLENFISDHPGSRFREEAYYLKLSAATNLAVNSTYNKKRERLEDAMDAYNAFMRYYPESEFVKDAEKLHSDIEKETEAFNAFEESLTR